MKLKMYKTIILPAVLYGYGCEAWSLTLRKEYLDLKWMRMESEKASGA